MSTPSAARVAYRYLTGNSLTLTGNGREAYMDHVWTMYENTYRRIGMSISSAQGLMKYPVWEVIMDKGEPVAFNVYKTTSFGMKSGLSGHNGSGAGKSSTVRGIRTKFLRSGVYGEVSHKVRDIALSAGAPVVCATLASSVLGKPTKVTGDITYIRALRGVGPVEKTLIGRPKGVPTTDHRNPSCPVEGEGDTVRATFLESDDDDGSELDSYYCDLMIASLI